MESSRVERRRGRRISLTAPLVIRRADASAGAAGEAHVTKNVSLAGLYFETDQQQAYKLQDVVIASVSVPDTQTREFPFTRLAGRGRVVRVDALPAEHEQASTRCGVALEFGEDLTALTAIPSR